MCVAKTTDGWSISESADHPEQPFMHIYCFHVSSQHLLLVYNMTTVSNLHIEPRSATKVGIASVCVCFVVHVMYCTINQHGEDVFLFVWRLGQHNQT